MHNRIVSILDKNVKISLALLCAELMEYVNRIYYKNEYIWDFYTYPELEYNEAAEEVCETGETLYSMLVVNYKKDDNWKYKSFVESVARLLSSPYNKPNKGEVFQIELNKPADYIKALFAKKSDYSEHDHFICDSNDDIHAVDTSILESFVVSLHQIE